MTRTKPPDVMCWLHLGQAGVSSVMRRTRRSDRFALKQLGRGRSLGLV
ncbi:hypothetical protein [Streptomyces sp. MNU89]|nr:hypothetical protein [Streptomyces sp. MNU89]MCC9740390.1 hypothetical protein [Streptomyces sp. MNU89]